jgi:DNA-binding beta-propeller fold protein YncE
LVDKFKRLVENPTLHSKVTCPYNFLRDIGSAGHDQFWILSSRSKDLKLMDSKGQEIKNVKTSDQPWRLAVSCDRKFVFYSDIRSKTVMKVDANSGKVSQMFATGEYEPRGIGACQSGDVLVCLYSPGNSSSKVIKYNQAGKEILQIEYDENKRSIYMKPQYVIESKTGGICVSDYGKREVILVDVNGAILFSYDGNKAIGVVDQFIPEGITTDSRGNFLIADYWSNTVHVLTENGTFVCYLHFGKIEGPTGIAIDDSDRLWVCEYSTSSGIVKSMSHIQ